jgi:hypothetical protein
MLVISVLLSLGLLAIFIVPLASGQKPATRYVLFAAPALIIGWPCVLFPPLALQYVLLAGLHTAACYWRVSAHAYLAAASAVTVLVYVGIGWANAQYLTALRAEFPYESMEVRLSPSPQSRAQRGKPISDAFLWSLEAPLSGRNARQGESLMSLHEHTVQEFIMSPGFGVSRMPTLESKLRRSLAEETSVPQPEPLRLSPFDYREETPTPGIPDYSEFTRLHETSFFDFFNPERFGYLKDRAHVAGFRPHQFKELPRFETLWALQRIELIGLVLRDYPVVYVSEHLPRMDLLAKAPVRRLDTFEGAGLDALRKGQFLHIGEQNGRLRVIGALRATQQCTECHNCERGELLGAFSYQLRRRS